MADVTSLTPPSSGTNLRRLFQKNVHMFHRMFEIAARLMIFHVKHVCMFQLNRGKIRDLDPAIS